MLDQLDLSKKLPKSEYKTIMPSLEIRLGTLQRQILEHGIPVIITFDGPLGAGKGSTVNRLIRSLDPRGYSVHSTTEPTDEERLYPFLWRYWIRTPAKGRMAIFDRSWHSRIPVDLFDKSATKADSSRRCTEANSFERKLADDGTVIIKLFLQVSKKEQKKRLKELTDESAITWRLTKPDWARHKKYDRFIAVAQSVLARTDTSWAKWTIVEAHDRRYTRVKVFRTICEALERRIADITRSTSSKRPHEAAVNLDELPTAVLDDVDLSPELTREEYEKKLEKRQIRIRTLSRDAYTKRIPVVIAYEGWDAAGKGGNIRRLTRGMDPRGYEVIPIGTPNDIEKQHHYLWRFWKAMPPAGHIAIFDRSWYGRVMVERVERYATDAEWKRAFREINDMEEQLVNFGAVLVKFWLHIDKDEQLRRFQEREKIPHKRWKITDADWRNREKWDCYLDAVNEMLYRTSTEHAPWTIVESNCKLHARVKTLDTISKAIESAL
jgi:polyphosphate:AMP phosphotransferase